MMAQRPGESFGHTPPGTQRPKRWRAKFHYELIDCGLHGHELLGTDVAHIRPQDALVVREPGDGLRWHRCLRCDAWLPLLPPPAPGPTVSAQPRRDLRAAARTAAA